MSTAASLKLQITADQTTAPDLGSLIAHVENILNLTFSDGAGASQANVVYASRRTLAASATEDLDLSGALTQPNGAAAVFARVKAILVKAAAANANNVNVQRHASAGVPIFLAASDGVAVQPNGGFCLVSPTAAGYAVTATTADLITLTNSAGGTSVTFDIVIIGAAT
jgi:hypothetical protein